LDPPRDLLSPEHTDDVLFKPSKVSTANLLVQSGSKLSGEGVIVLNGSLTETTIPQMVPHANGILWTQFLVKEAVQQILITRIAAHSPPSTSGMWLPIPFDTSLLKKLTEKKEKRTQIGKN
jgi:hypothetical protein